MAGVAPFAAGMERPRNELLWVVFKQNRIFSGAANCAQLSGDL